MNNTYFSKTMENVLNCGGVKIVHGSAKRKLEKLIAKPNYKGSFIFTESNLVSVRMGKTTVLLNKPVYLGKAILDISKVLMNEFHYGYVTPKWGERDKLLFTHTDLLCYELTTEDFYEDMRPDVYERFDTSDFPKDHPCGLPFGLNKKALGFMKDEAKGKIITEFVGLRPKLYAYATQDYCDKCYNKEFEKKTKGVKKQVIRKTLHFHYYKDCLFNATIYLTQFNTIQSCKHEITTECATKVALSGEDDKRFLLGGPKHKRLALGHYRIRK